MGKAGELLSVAEGQEIVLRHCRPVTPEAVPLASAPLGLVLAEDVASDLDMPPYDKALMDGYALRAADLASGQAELEVVEEITAGRVPARSVGPGQAARIMTGAPIPSGADAVVIVERTRLLDGKRVRIDDKPPKPGQNVLRRGAEMRKDEAILMAGTALRPQEFGVLATVGRTAVKAHPPPVVALMTTGDEVVEASQQPGPGQIRNGNSPMLAAQIVRAGGVPRYLGIAGDRVESLRRLIDEGLRSPMLALSGGVSAGLADLVPGVLRDAGVAPHFHKVAMKPGKPIYFGTRGDTLVFGLPGNPVSSFACFELFVRPAIRRVRGHADAGPNWVNATLAENFTYATDRPTYHPAWLDTADSGWRVRAVPWFGSADLRGLTRANALVLLEAGSRQYAAGESRPVMKIEE
ncbi:MAG TPA: gephyrin-like molybdotransferase Glp [Gemmataceae bacterium]|nr:gephyrin-like molybdotransferase Glp [Gemmataceae bacterium]